MGRPKVICYCGSLRVALEAFKKAEYQSVIDGNIALLPCCMFVDIQREYGAESNYKVLADELHKRKIDLCDFVVVLNVNGYVGESTRSEIEYALSISTMGRPMPDNFIEQAKILRVFELLNMIACGQFTVKALAYALDTSERTIYRYLHLLRAIGFQLRITDSYVVLEKEHYPVFISTFKREAQATPPTVY